MQLEFFKYQGTGNDFILLDNRNGAYDTLTEKQVKFLCNRRFGIGADGLMLLNKSEKADFEMKYFNADGKEGSMCGNGSRCIIKFASKLGIKKSTYHFTASDGDHKGEIDSEGLVKLKMADVNKVRMHSDYFIVDT